LRVSFTGSISLNVKVHKNSFCFPSVCEANRKLKGSARLEAPHRKSYLVTSESFVLVLDAADIALLSVVKNRRTEPGKVVPKTS
jgi:hypothetical protein